MFYTKANESRENHLPTYEDATELTTRGAEPPISENLPEVDKVFERTTKAGDVVETVIMSHTLTHVPESLERFLRAQADAVPSPVVRIRGTHSSKTRPTEEVDFDVTVCLHDCLSLQGAQVKAIPNGWKTYRSTRTKTDGLNYDAEAIRPELSVMEWCRDFCTYRYGPKEYAFKFHQ